MMLITRHGGDEFLPVGQGGGLLAEKPLAQVVVNADDLEPFAGKSFDAFRSDQSGGAGDNHCAHKNYMPWN